MQIPRFYADLAEYLEPNKALVIFGPRQVGKTTILKNFLKETRLKYRFDYGDDIKLQSDLGSQESKKILAYAEGYELVVIDEAQKIPNIGIALKIMVDQIPGIRIIVTGSSSFELAGQVGEPLTGRKNTLTLFPIAQMELRQLYNSYDLAASNEEYLIYGGYPAVVAADGNAAKKQLLEELLGSYLLKDILELDRVKNSKILLDLLRLLAFQIGSEVSLSELGRQIGMDYKTVARYLDLLEKSFVLYNLRGFSRNLCKEVTKKSKYYFFDNGIRNAVIANFNGLDLRDDKGRLWENFVFMERLKKRSYSRIYANPYFWRTWDRKEIDLVEEREGKLFGYEFKYGKIIAKEPNDWKAVYPESEFLTVNQDNYLEFV